MCQSGAREVQEQVLSNLKTDKLRIFVIWLPQYQGDDRTKAIAATQLVPDYRARHFWDGEGFMGKRFAEILDLPDNHDFAWDVYLLYNHLDEWNEGLPQPCYWMHQLGPDTAHQPRLDAKTFCSVVQRSTRLASSG